MEWTEPYLRQAALYPRWLVAAAVMLTAIAALWLVAKLLKWTVSLLLALMAFAAVSGVVIWFFL